jgi:site-specific recombinase XerD
MLFPRLYRYVLLSFNRHSTDRGFVQSNSFQRVRRATVLTTKLHAPKDHYSRGETSERILFIMCRCKRGVGGWASDTSALIAARDVATWRSPAARLSDHDINAALSDDPARSRPRPGPANRGAVRLSQSGSGGKGARSNPNYCAARLCRSGVAGHCRLPIANCRLKAVHHLEDLEAKTRGLWWGCGGWTTRSYAKRVNTLSPTLWPCGNKQVERFFQTVWSDLLLTRDLNLELSVLAMMNESQRQRLKLMAERFSEWLEAINYSPKTRVNYTRDVQLFLDWLAENTAINSLVEVTPAQLQQYQIALYNFERRADNGTATKEKTAKRLSVGTQANRLAAVCKFFSWLLREQQIAYNPAATLQLPKQPQRLPRGVLTKAEARRLIEATPAVKPREVRDRAILETLYATGIRRAELITLTIYDTDLQMATLKVEGRAAANAWSR